MQRILRRAALAHERLYARCFATGERLPGWAGAQRPRGASAFRMTGSRRRRPVRADRSLRLAGKPGG